MCLECGGLSIIERTVNESAHQWVEWSSWRLSDLDFEFCASMKLDRLGSDRGPLKVGAEVRLHFDRVGMQQELREALGSKAPELEFEAASETLD
jgi:hypothetical protein